jgi:HlyD family secretion protein
MSFRRRGVQALGLMAVAVLVAVGAMMLRPAPAPPIGMVRVTESKIQPEVSGRIAALPLRTGSPVLAGDVVAVLRSPELAASVAEAQAAVAEAKATRNRVYAGVRAEQVNSAAREIEKAKADATLAQQSFGRVSGLARRDDASQQRLDEARRSLLTAEANVRAAQSHYDEARRGPTAEERVSADASVASAEASLAVLERRLEKLTLRAPAAGIIRMIIGELGEATVPGRTVATIKADGGQWFQFNIREDRLLGLDIGKSVILIEGAEGRTIPARISELRRLGDFATWRAARAVGDYDLNTFAVRADPVNAIAELEPGVTVWLSSSE